MNKNIRRFEVKGREQEEFTVMLLKSMPEDKKEVLRKALQRNFDLTSSWTLELGTLTVYKEGWYIELEGCRSGFKAFILDNDRFDEVGDTPFKTIKKPVDSKLSPLYWSSLHMWECDYEEI